MNWVKTFQTTAYLFSLTSQTQGPIEEAEKSFLEPLSSTAQCIVWTGCVDRPMLEYKGAEVWRISKTNSMPFWKKIIKKEYPLNPPKSAKSLEESQGIPKNKPVIQHKYELK